MAKRIRRWLPTNHVIQSEADRRFRLVAVRAQLEVTVSGQFRARRRPLDSTYLICTPKAQPWSSVFSGCRHTDGSATERRDRLVLRLKGTAYGLLTFLAQCPHSGLTPSHLNFRRLQKSQAPPLGSTFPLALDRFCRRRISSAESGCSGSTETLVDGPASVSPLSNPDL